MTDFFDYLEQLADYSSDYDQIRDAYLSIQFEEDIEAFILTYGLDLYESFRSNF